MNTRFDRHLRLFGEVGQDSLSRHTVAIVGAGGLGSIAILQAAYLGVGKIIVIDHEEADESNLNRYVSLRHNDIYSVECIRKRLPKKTEIAERMIAEINPNCVVIPVARRINRDCALDILLTSHSIIGCVDNDSTRMILTEAASTLGTQYFDFASDIESTDKVRYGGRVFVVDSRRGCLCCANEIDLTEASIEILDPNLRNDRNDIYGVDKSMLNIKGPSVVSLNGVVASIGMMEWLVAITEIREPKKAIYYRGLNGTVSVNNSPSLNDFCYFCDELRVRSKSSSNIGRRSA